MASDKINFHIIEGETDYEFKFSDFQEDFLNGVSKKELVDKYEIPPRIWREWRDKIVAHHNVSRKTSANWKKPRQKRRVITGDNFFRRTYKGNITLLRKMPYGRNLSYGSYPTRIVAEKVRDLLVANDWDKMLAFELLQEYGVPNSKRTLSRRLLKRNV